MQELQAICRHCKAFGNLRSTLLFRQVAAMLGSLSLLFRQLAAIFGNLRNITVLRPGMMDPKAPFHFQKFHFHKNT